MRRPSSQRCFSLRGLRDAGRRAGAVGRHRSGAAVGCAQAPLQNPNPESIQIGLSTNRVEITADFSGADLTIFGSLENADPLVSRQGRYDVIVVLEGPARETVVRRKDRVLGMWINMESETFTNVPVSYSVATTRQPQDITDTEQLQAAVARRRQSAHPAARPRRQPGDDRGIPRGAARPQGGGRPLQHARRRRRVPVAEPVPRLAAAVAERAGGHA